MVALIAGTVAAGDDKVCAACHIDIYRSYEGTPMARTSGLVGPENTAVSHPLEFSANETHYSVSRGAGGVWLQEEERDRHAKQQLQYFIGAGEIGRSYAYSIDGFVFQAPVAHYTSTGQWSLSPGFELSSHVVLTRPVEKSCFNCHASRLRPITETRNGYETPAFQVAGVSCERCHGPAEDHLARLKAGNRKTGSGIVNPAKLEGERRDSICAQCHLSGAVRIAKTNNGEPYQPGGNLFESSSFFFWTDNSKSLTANSHFEQLTRSACWKNSRNVLWCGTCHNPHTVVPKAEKAAYYRSRCETCHSSSAPSCTASLAIRKQVQDNCISCHMATKPMATVQHAAQTDHTIPRVLRPIPSNGESSSPSLVPFPGTEPAEREIALAYASVALEANNRELGTQAFQKLRALATDLSEDPAVKDQLAQLYDKTGQASEACRLFIEAANQNAAPVGALINAGACLAKQGQVTGAMQLWQQALVQNPAEESARLNLAVAQARAGDLTAARATLTQGLRFDPFSIEASQLLENLR